MSTIDRPRSRPRESRGEDTAEDVAAEPAPTQGVRREHETVSQGALHNLNATDRCFQMTHITVASLTWDGLLEQPHNYEGDAVYNCKFPKKESLGSDHFIVEFNHFKEN